MCASISVTNAFLSLSLCLFLDSTFVENISFRLVQCPTLSGTRTLRSTILAMIKILMAVEVSFTGVKDGRFTA